MHHEQALIQSESISNHLRIIEGHLRIISLRTEQKDIRDRVINLLKIMADLQTDIGSKQSPENGLQQTQSAIYGLVSVSRSLVDESKIPLVCETIYSKAKVRNAQLGLTGYLIHFADSFIQFLEGPKENLEYLYGRIVLNPIHEDTRILFNGPIEKRYFDKWSMGYALTDSTEEAKVKQVIDRKITNKVGRFLPEELIGIMNFIDFYTMQSG